MAFHPDLRLLLASDGAALPVAVQGAVAQLSAVCDVDLTVAHVATGGGGEAPRPLTFEHGAGPRRLQRLELPGSNAAGAIADLCGQRTYDLVLAPGSSSSAPWRALRPSFRARLLSRIDVPVWTIGRDLPSLHFHRPLRTVACLLDFDTDPEPLLQRAAAFARRMDARLHVLAVLPPVDDGTLATVLTSETPLLPAAAVARIEQLSAGRATPIVDVVVDGLRRGLTRLLKACQPDVLFVRAAQWSTPWRQGFPRALDALTCPVICVPETTDAVVWSFERAAALAGVAAAHDRAAAAGAGVATPWPAEGIPSRAL